MDHIDVEEPLKEGGNRLHSKSGKAAGISNEAAAET
jgi:hypothetical protein